MVSAQRDPYILGRPRIRKQDVVSVADDVHVDFSCRQRFSKCLQLVYSLNDNRQLREQTILFSINFQETLGHPYFGLRKLEC